MNGKLSNYWTQELIGSDLLREELEYRKNKRAFFLNEEVFNNSR